jgi:hypothetical protein
VESEKEPVGTAGKWPRLYDAAAGDDEGGGLEPFGVGLEASCVEEAQALANSATSARRTPAATAVRRPCRAVRTPL